MIEDVIDFGDLPMPLPQVQPAVAEELLPTVEVDLQPLKKIAKQLSNNLNRLFQFGTLVSVHSRVWSMSTALEPDDLGMTVKPDNYKLGVKMLMKPEVWDFCENRMDMSDVSILFF